jgi:hypothetical protein
MDDGHAAELGQLQALRLIRAFARIADASERHLVIELAEQLASETACEPTESVLARADGLPAGPAKDTPIGANDC